MKALISRLKEPSTYAGLATVAIAVGISMEDFTAWAAAAASVAGFLSIVLGERGDENLKRDLPEILKYLEDDRNRRGKSE